MINGFTVFIRQNDAPRENNYLQFILLAICIGGIGAVYYLSKPDDSLLKGRRIYDLGSVSSPAVSPKAVAVALTETKQVERPKHKFLVNVKIAEAMEPTLFTIDQLEGFDLSINYGDGTEEQVSGRRAVHTYKLAGNFQVQLKAKFNGQTEVFEKKMLCVAHPIEIEMVSKIVDRD